MALRIRQKTSRGIWTKAVLLSVVFVFVAQYVGVQVDRRVAALSSHSVVINEVMPATGAGEKWVELYNRSDTPVDISKWRLVRGSGNFGLVVPEGTFISPHGLYVITAASSDSLPLSNTTSLRLQTGSDEASEVDSVESWKAAAGKSYARTGNGSDDWAYGAPSKGEDNDLTPPEVTFLTPADNPQKDLKLSVRVTDDHLHQVSFDVTRLSDNASFSTRKIMTSETKLELTEYDLCAASIVHGTTPDCDEDWIKDGAYRIRAKAYGSKGPSNTSVTGKVVVDTVAPTLNAELEAQKTNGYVTNNDFAIKGKAADERSGLNQVVIVLQRAGQTTVEGGKLTLQPGGGFTFSLNDVSDGAYSAYVSAWDRAGNKTEYPVITFTVDTHNPVIKISSPAEGQTVSKELAISGMIQDAGAVTYGYVIRNANGEVVRSADGLHEPTLDRKVVLEGLVSGKYTLTIDAEDAAGHSASKAVMFMIDHTAPQLTISGPQELKLDGAATFTITSTETLSGFPSVFINGVLFDGVVEQIEDTVWKFRYVPPAVASYSVTVSASDRYHNVSSSRFAGASFVLRVLANPPTADQTSSANLRLQSASTALAQPLIVNTPPKTEKDDIEKPAVLGSETHEGVSAEVPVIAPSNVGWQIMGVAWYWWVLIATAIGGAVWTFVALRRRGQEPEIL